MEIKENLNKYDKKWLSDFVNFDEKLASDEEIGKERKRFLSGLSELYKKMIVCNQSETSVDKPKKVKRVIRINRYIDKYLLDKYDKDWYLFNGLYVVVSAFLIPADIIDCCLEKDNCYGGGSLKSYNCPTDKEYLYSAIRMISDDTYMVIKKDDLLEEKLTYKNSWYYIGQKEI